MGYKEDIKKVKDDRALEAKRESRKDTMLDLCGGIPEPKGWIHKRCPYCNSPIEIIRYDWELMMVDYSKCSNCDYEYYKDSSSHSGVD